MIIPFGIKQRQRSQMSIKRVKIIDIKIGDLIWNEEEEKSCPVEKIKADKHGFLVYCYNGRTYSGQAEDYLLKSP